MATAILATLWLYHLYDSHFKSRIACRIKPIPLPANPTLTPDDVTIICPTIDTPSTFPLSLRSFLANKPREIHIVTIKRDIEHVLDLVRPVLTELGVAEGVVTVSVAEYASKRAQMTEGIRRAKGKIIVNVDDDVFWKEETLKWLIAPFENENVGGCVGKKLGYLPKASIDPESLTPWQVASQRGLYTRGTGQATCYTADGGTITLPGTTLVVCHPGVSILERISHGQQLMRASMVQDKRFLHHFMNDYWLGSLIDSGDDSFITRWVHTEGWACAIQHADEADVETAVMPDKRLLHQMLRWTRSSIQSNLRMMWCEPGLLKVWAKHPYMARKIIERFVRPVLAWVHILAFVQGFRQNSWMAYFAALWYLWGMYESYSAFVRRFPWASRHAYAAVLMDYGYLVMDVIGWLTLGTEAWGTRSCDEKA